ncbi:transmembrane protein 223-like [Saccoglossus kowalevskii]|uniref:Transmembrane protein 223-like n=1 Tax=Saccoglossus kowalevskii TaxID=10224 RepID=A0ABM0GX32_SACKO|nr:PREDICTED: transmembrane protein 223-like [Saccoglossus kowalevskii]
MYLITSFARKAARSCLTLHLTNGCSTTSVSSRRSLTTTLAMTSTTTRTLRTAFQHMCTRNAHRQSVFLKRMNLRHYYGRHNMEQGLPDTNIVKDILLYENKNFVFYRVIGITAVIQYILCLYAAHVVYNGMRDTRYAEMSIYGDKRPPPEKRKKISYFGFNIELGSSTWKNCLTVGCAGFGGLIMAAIWMYSRRSVHQLVLRRGGQNCTVVPFGFFGRPFHFTVPVKSMSCRQTRDQVDTHLPIKIKRYSLFFLLDKKGKFYNAKLFDFTVGMRRVV